MLMRAFLATTILGSFVFDKDGNIIDKRLFVKKPEIIAKKLDTPGFLPEEEELLLLLIKKGYKEVFTAKKTEFPGIAIMFDEENLGKKTLQENFRKLAISLKWISSQAELNELLTRVQVLRTSEKLREERRDTLIIHAVGVIGELEKDLNNFSERLREWYGLHFPELSGEIASAEKYAEAIAKYGERSDIKGFEKISQESVGMEFSQRDISQIRDFSRVLFDLYQQKKSLTGYVELLCREVLPNTSTLAGEIIAARLLSAAGGLEKLSRLPSSTVQLLGAEKALFRHLKGEGKSPKFGVLFFHPFVQQAPNEKRGKIARLLAAKISLAARIDYYSKEDKSAALKRDLEEQMKRL